MTSHRAKQRSVLLRWLPPVLVVVGIVAGAITFSHFHGARPHLAPPPKTVSPAAQIHASTVPVAPSRVAAPSPRPTPPSPCRTSTDAQHVIVSVSQQHAWICAGSRQLKDSAVTTGASATGDGTPLGTWHIQVKQTNRVLSVLTGEAYHVEYWMPYDGNYGFHDSAWQTFPYGSQQYRTAGSHGCVHFPLSTMAWLYNWAHLGATVTIKA